MDEETITKSIVSFMSIEWMNKHIKAININNFKFGF